VSGRREHARELARGGDARTPAAQARGRRAEAAPEDRLALVEVAAEREARQDAGAPPWIDERVQAGPAVAACGLGNAPVGRQLAGRARLLCELVLEARVGDRDHRCTALGVGSAAQVGDPVLGHDESAQVPRYVFDLGPSFKYEDWTVNEIVASSLPVSVSLGLGAIVIALFVGLGAGVVGAVRPNSPIDLITLLVALVGISVPSFVTGTLLLIVGPVALGIGQVGGWGDPLDAVLPAFTLSLPFAAYIARLTRMGMIEALSADYIRTARAKGVSPSSVVVRHALKNAFLPVLSYLGPAAAFAMTGSFVVEMVFNVPGIGQHFVDAVRNKDLFLIMGVTLIFAGMLVVFNLVVDVLYRWVDPRIEE